MTLPRSFIFAPIVLAACTTRTPNVSVGADSESDGSESESEGGLTDLPDSESETDETETGETDDPTGDPPDDPDGDPTGPGARLPPYSPNCEFIETALAFAVVDTSPEANQGGLGMGPCGHVATNTQLFFPDGSVTESGGSLSFAPTGDIATVYGGDTIELIDLVTRTRRSVAREQHGFVASFVDGVTTRVWTCADGRLEVHDGAQTWLLDEGLDGCGGIEAAEAAPVIAYRHGSENRVVHSDTGEIVTLALVEDAPASDCHRVQRVGYDGDAIAFSWICYETIPGGSDEPIVIDVLRGTSLYSCHTGLRVLANQANTGARQVPIRGGAWWFSPSFVDSSSAGDDRVSLLVDGDLQPLLEENNSTWIADGTVFASNNDPDASVGTLVRSDDGGREFVNLGSRPNMFGGLRANWERTAVAVDTVVDFIPTGLDLWINDAWPWPQAIEGDALDAGPLFADGALIVHADMLPRTSLYSPLGEPLAQWDEWRTAIRLDERMVLAWGDAYPDFIPGGLALLESDGSTSLLVPDAEPSAAWSVKVAPLVGIVAAWMTDGNQRALWYGRPE